MRAGWMLVALAATAAGAFAACAEGGNGDLGGLGGKSSSTSSTGSTGTASTSSGTTGSTGSTSSGTAPGAKVVINEISAKGGDWIELYNPGAAAADIGGYGLCDDVDPTMGHMCDTGTIVTFPTGTTVPPGGFLLVVGNEPDDAGVGPHVMCLDSGPTTCFYATWKVSASNGEMVHLLDPSQAVVDEELYPMNAVSSGETWGRLPDGTGAFAANKPTPGAANAGP